MEIYISKDGQKQGPYTPEEVRARIASGQFLESDLGWHAGVTDWQPLSQLLASLPMAPGGAAAGPKSSGFAKASFIIAMVGIVGWLVLVVAAGAAVANGMTSSSPLLVGIGLFMFIGLAVNLAGAIFGILAVVKPISNKWMAVTGIIVNALELLGILLLMIVGMMTKK